MHSEPALLCVCPHKVNSNLFTEIYDCACLFIYPLILPRFCFILTSIVRHLNKLKVMIFSCDSFRYLYSLKQLLQYLFLLLNPLGPNQIPQYHRIQAQTLIRSDPVRPDLPLLHALLVELEDLCELIVVGLVGGREGPQVLIRGDQVHAV